MDLNIYIIDDDISIRQILKNIILSKKLGNIIGESDEGEDGLNKIFLSKPNIVIVDLLLPNLDGIELIERAREINQQMLFIMISQVSSKEMVARAYESGIEYFINKPINVNEVESVMKKVIEKYKLTETLRHFESAFKLLKDMNNNQMMDNTKQSIKEPVKLILSQLGILGEAGSKDIIEIVYMLSNNRIHKNESLTTYKTSDIYKLLCDYYCNNYNQMECSEKAIEQRVRRSIGKALRNIASLGLEDYGDFTFSTYSNTLFDFQEVRMEMEYLKEKSKYRGKINVKKFLEGIILFANQA
ncbi:response regulator [Alkaliphilus peptidifermentans]|uniref:Stage 0 sporulation protein A homolog n=1 Tax=Alkaliphilus peptidifermentans DSM 18978 TaxID=1120976 RepID=A0A1G5CLR5_9FIRM|nr:response regulator [Alkaliphilus peptidifermentans]SCY03393.1 two-component system, response regulator YcbB [Alkaliphilus peptidifermentans DSM 18978]